MSENPFENPLIVQSDRTILLDIHSPNADAARDHLARFSELVKSPEHVHTYRLTPLSIWNACAAGMAVDDMTHTLTHFAKYPPPEFILSDIRDLADRYGCVILEKDGNWLKLSVRDIPTAELLSRDKNVSPWLGKRLEPLSFRISPAHRGVLKQALVEAGYPAEDRAGFTDGETLSLSLARTARSGEAFSVRDYQQDAVEAFYQSGSNLGGSGVVCLPCGAGKTIVGISAMAKLKQTTLILTTNLTSVKQWRRELLDKTDISDDMIAEYTGEHKNIGPVTLSTYQILTWRKNKNADFPHFSLFHARPWGLIIYDEVHLLPAPVFRITAELQARRRLGMTATLIREDGHEEDVFALIGPKRYDVPWRILEAEGWIADAVCTEIRIPMPEPLRMEYALAPRRSQFRVAAENPEKLGTASEIIAAHPDARVLIIGEYLRQLQYIADALKYPLINGKTPPKKREELYSQFREGRIRHLILSRVGNFALDLPDADVLIQVSGIFGSRQEEAQRLGRILRPKKDGRQARFYTLVSQHTREEEYARNRQLFLTEQGYSYELNF
ncbi:DNA repair helicase XPB [Desulfonema magnum]|uniref:DNA 3'-5' helicase n=1 Tax=Desulfonema magnum TaxID=45655 RepID=A0A975BNZ2_9BACT|nr:DNA repair helicase XPB [Desulfonema magnum]QTA89011.1 Helicase family protein [Desulfonema magnum]